MAERQSQARQALELANAVRLRKAQLKRDLKSGVITLEQALDHPELQDWTAGDVLGFACIGEARWKGKGTPKKAPELALDLLQHAAVGHSRPVGRLTGLERELILRRAREKAARRGRHRRVRLSRQASHAGPRFLD